ncbi:MAG: hypothetical protein MUC51_19655, partial [Anaerolineae bacterium]|nr:hypothetical protein [Anaerolineae bacterium]
MAPEERTAFHLGNARHPHLTLTPEDVARSQEVNQSVYLVKAPALFYALERLRPDNAQREEYLSDIVSILAQVHDHGRQHYRVATLTVTDPSLVMGFNNPAELLEIENTLRAKEAASRPAEAASAESYRPGREWLALFSSLAISMPEAEDATGFRGYSRLDLARQEPAEASSPEHTAPTAHLRDHLAFIYGDHPDLVQERLGAYRELSRVCVETLGPDRRVLISRAPGRMNIMGRHVDHQGGHTNLMAIDREVLLAASARDDDEVRLYNVQPDQFAARRFSIGELLTQLTWDDWLSLVNSEAVQQMVMESGGDWAQYVRAAVLRLQKHYHGIKLHGLDIIVHGTVPVAAGLSSSSALVVATAEAVVALNSLDMRPRQFVDLCGEGEWF